MRICGVDNFSVTNAVRNGTSNFYSLAEWCGRRVVDVSRATRGWFAENGEKIVTLALATAAIYAMQQVAPVLGNKLDSFLDRNHNGLHDAMDYQHFASFD